MNAINVIIPYRWEGMWVFDDERAGLDKEPFVAGADDIIDLMVADIPIPNAAEGFRLIFAASPFPGHTHTFERRREEHGGHWYYSLEFGQEGWLCPALFKYFDSAPDQLFVKAEVRQ